MWPWTIWQTRLDTLERQILEVQVRLDYLGAPRPPQPQKGPTRLRTADDVLIMDRTSRLRAQQRASAGTPSSPPPSPSTAPPSTPPASTSP
jgi:hypothetical protein